MKSMFRRMLVGLVGVALLLGVAAMQSGQSAQASDDQAKRAEAKQPQARQVQPKPLQAKRVKTPRERLAERSFPNVTLTTHEGKKVRFYDDLIKDKIVLINFMYVKCDGICPGTTANLLKVQQMLGSRVGRDIFMYSITLKPEEDTPEVLNQYAKAYKVKPGWLFLTGDPKDVELLRQKLGFIDRDPVRDADKSNHIGMLRFGNEPMTLWAGCPGLLGPSKIVKEISLVDWPEGEEAGRGGER